MSIFSTEERAFVSHNKSVIVSSFLIMCFSSVFFYYFSAFLRNVSFFAPASTGNANGNS